MHYLYTDGGSRGNPGKSAIAFFLFDQDMKLIDFGGKYVGIGTNNSAEYSALILGLEAASKHGVEEIQCNLDSELVVKQLKGEYKISNADMKSLSNTVMSEVKNFKVCKFNHVFRESNKFADKLVNIILDSVN